MKYIFQIVNSPQNGVLTPFIFQSLIILEQERLATPGSNKFYALHLQNNINCTVYTWLSKRNRNFNLAQKLTIIQVTNCDKQTICWNQRQISLLLPEKRATSLLWRRGSSKNWNLKLLKSILKYVNESVGEYIFFKKEKI